MTATLRLALFTLLLAPSFSHAGLKTGSEDNAVFGGLPYPIEAALTAGQKLGAVGFETPYSLTPAAEYDTVLLQGEMSDPALRVEIAVKGRSFFSAATVYAPSSSRRFSNGRFWARFSVPLTRQPFKLRVVNLGAADGAKLSFYEAEMTVESLSREAPPPPAEKPYIPDPSLSLPYSAPFKMIRRAEWKAELPKSSYTLHQPFYFTLHHTQGNYPKTPEAAISEIQFVQDYHQNAKKWIDIGYHFMVDPFGNIYEGRPIRVEGAHVLSRNTGNIGISIMGNYHPPVSNLVTPASAGSFVTIGRYLKDTYAVNVSSFYAHRDIGNSDCPGDDLYAKKPELATLIFTPQPVPLPVNLADAPPLTPAQQQSLTRLKAYLLSIE